VSVTKEKKESVIENDSFHEIASWKTLKVPL